MADMDIAAYLSAERGAAARLAKGIGKSPAFVSQLSRMGRPVPPLVAVAIERETQGVVRRWAMRPTDWHLIWPELVGTEGAPPPPAANDPQQQEQRHAA